MDKPRIITHIEKSLNYTIFDVKWIPGSAKFVVIGSKPRGTGVLQIYELCSGELNLLKEVERKSSFKCGTFGASGLRSRHIAVGDFAGRLQIIDLERPDISIFNVEAHNGIINTIDATGGMQINCGAPEIVTGGCDGVVKVWDPRESHKPVVNMEPVTCTDGKKKDCWAVTFGDSYNNDERLVGAGFNNGDMKLFDLRQLKVRWEHNLEHGICSMEFDRKDIPMNKMVVTTLQGGLYVYDMRTQHPEKGFTCCTEKDAGRSVGSNGLISGRKATIWTVKHLPQNRDIFTTCSGTGAVRLWNYNYPSKRRKDDGDGHELGVGGSLQLLHASTASSQPVNCFDWSPDKIGLAVCGAFDQTVRILITTKLNLY